MNNLQDAWISAGQGHVFQHPRTQPETDKLFENLGHINIDRVVSIFNKATKSGTAATTSLSPLPKASFDSTLTSLDNARWAEIGFDLIRKNQVAVILLAGGQGTRLGSSAPKGCYDIGLPSNKSLFELQGDRIRKMQIMAGNAIIPWYVMTSGPTRQATESFFKVKNYFGLDPANIFFFEQGVLPAFTPDGKIFMESIDTPAVAPDGNGGIYAALRSEGVIADLERRKIPFVHAYCVDNCLVKVADPVFIGYCVEKNADCGAKCVGKLAPDEPAGVICLRNDKFEVLEYSEIDPAISQLKGTDGKLIYNAANIANHFYTTEFLKKINSFEGELQYHIARKKITHLNSEGIVVKPDVANGIKLELFIFDVFPFTERMAVLEVAREDEFSPLKNAPGCKDGASPDTSRNDIFAQHVR